MGYLYIVISGEGDALYSIRPQMGGPDLVYGVVQILLGVAYIVIRFRLAQLRKNAPITLSIALVCEAVLKLIYIIAGSVIVTSEMLQDAPGLLIFVALAAVCAVYYRKRAHLFVN